MHNDFFKEIKKDHQEVKGLLDQLKKTSNGAEKKREELFMKLKQELMPHMKAEEKVFYPALLEKKDVREDTLESIEEHHVSELVFKELDKMPKSEEQWLAKLKVFSELIDHHVEEEESTIFEDADKALGHDQMHAILEQFRAEKEKIRKRL